MLTKSDKEYYLKQIKKVLILSEDNFILKVKSIDRNIESHNLTLSKELLIVIYNTIQNDL